MKLLVAKSSISGLGIFAGEDIGVGETLGVAFYSISPLSKMCEDQLDKAIKRTILGQYINHDDTPNCTILKSDDLMGWTCEYVTCVPINKGQEITIDYTALPWPGSARFVAPLIDCWGRI